MDAIVDTQPTSMKTLDRKGPPPLSFALAPWHVAGQFVIDSRATWRAVEMPTERQT